MSRRATIVPHTHWDREWYEPFQTFRLRLVALLDELLPRLDADPSYTHFLLDGQMAVVDDYVAVRPGAAPVLRRLATSGRLAMGPWYTLPDEFLVSGETLVRDLQLGIEKAAAFGGAMRVGYLPDMFGHVAQMPQLLRLFGFEHAVVWRGVPLAIDRTAFWWEGPDGSTVRAEYLPDGYGNAAELPDDPKRLLDRVRAWEHEHHDRLADGPLLLMNGSDHLEPQPFLGRVVAQANRLADGDLQFEIGSLAAYLDAAPTDDLPHWKGELRSGARANLLMGVASNRVDVKQAAARAELALERVAEPMAALFAPAVAWPQALLDEAWLQVIRNAAHDSVCACSADEVCEAVLHRYHEAALIGQGLARQALATLADGLSVKGPVAVNPTARTRSGLVEVVVSGEAVPGGTQLVSRRAALQERLSLPARSAVPVLGDVVGWARDLSGVDYAVTDDGGVEVTLYTDGTSGEPATRAEVMDRVGTLTSGRDEAPVRVVFQGRPAVRVLARCADVPGFGWQAWHAGPLTVPPVEADERDEVALTLRNGLVTVRADRASGTFAVDGLAGLGRLVDGGDAGDTYNYSPPARDEIVDAPSSVEIEIAERGPLRGRLVIRSRHSIPRRVDDNTASRVGRVELDVTTTLEVRAGERLVRVTVALDNQADDHRLRVHLPLPQPAATSHAECAFAVVERGLTAEGGPNEVGLPTFPSRRFVQAGGLTVVHEGLLEYELVDVRSGAAHELALTLVRATRYLSRGPMAYRPMPAGPVIELAGSQAHGAHELRYGVVLGEVDPYQAADELLVPLSVTTGAGTGTLPSRHQALELRGAEVSAVRRRGTSLEVRVFNPNNDAILMQLPDRRGWVVDLRGRPLAPFDEVVPLAPWQLATLVIVD
jgi:alpha-mannosidase